MRAQTINQLAWYMPKREAVAGEYSLPAEVANILSEKQIAAGTHYAYCYKSLRFGWEFITHLVTQSHTLFPAFLRGDDLYLWRAYKHMQGFYDPVIAGALSFTTEGNKSIREGIEAMLLSPYIDDLETIAQHLSIPVAEISAYEKLFFNVWDRKQDNAYIASVLYPDGRLEESKKDYLETVTSEKLLRRAGKKFAPEMLLYMLGISEDHPYKTLNAAIAAGHLYEQLLQDGFLYSTLGLYEAQQSELARKVLQSALLGQKDAASNSAAVPVEETTREQAQHLSRLKAEAAQRNAFDAAAIYSTQDLNSK